jgi:hypothetical protein
MKIDVNFGKEILIEVEIEAVFTPGRPAPFCQDHDSPDFSDSGDSEEVDDLKVYLTRTSKRAGLIQLDITDFIDCETLEKLEDDVCENA